MKKIIAIVPENENDEYYYVDGNVSELFSQACKYAVETQEERDGIDCIDDVSERITEKEAKKRGYII